MSRRIIACSGFRRSGKDTLSDFLVNEFGFRKLSFAARLKDMVARDYGVPREWLDSHTFKEKPLEQFPAIPADGFTSALHTLLKDELTSGYWTPRALCILEGSAKRAVYSNYWVKAIAGQIMGDNETNYVISDLRYSSEADTLKLLLPGIELVRINRFDDITTVDPSERDLDKYSFDHVIENRGTVEEFQSRIVQTLYPVRGI